MFPNRLLIIIFVLAIWQFATTVSFAATASPAAETDTQAASPSATDTTDKLKERIDKVINQQKDKIRGVMDNAGLKKKALFGEVQRVTETNVTVKTAEGSQVFIIDETIGILRDNKKATIDDIAVGDSALALGYQKENEFVLRRLEVSSVSPKPAKPNILLGNFKSFNKAKTLMEYVGKFDQVAHGFAIDKNTLFQDNRAVTIKKEELKADQPYIILSIPTATGTPSASLVKSLAP